MLLPAPRPPNTVSLPIFCRGCGRPLTIAYVPGPFRVNNRDAALCPFGDCGTIALASVDLHGRISEIRPGHNA